MIQSQAIRGRRKDIPLLLETASKILGLNEKCLLFLEISSKLGDPMCFSFKKPCHTWSLG